MRRGARADLLIIGSASTRTNWGCHLGNSPREATSCRESGGWPRLAFGKELNNDVPVLPVGENCVEKKKHEHESRHGHEQLGIVPHRITPCLINGIFGNAKALVPRAWQLLKIREH